jgi:hypothetical protein
MNLCNARLVSNIDDIDEPTKAETAENTTEPTKAETAENTTEPTKAETAENTTEPTNAETDKAEPEADFGEAETSAHIVRLARDSGVALAGAAALLYLASHVYGTQYLELYGVEDGFHGFGLAHLAMIPLFSYVNLGCFGWVVYKTLSTESKLWLAVGNLLIIVVILVRLLYALAYGAGVEAVDVAALIIGAAVLIASLVLHRLVTPRIKKSVEAMAKALKARERLEQSSGQLAKKLELFGTTLATRADLNNEARSVRAEAADLLDLSKKSIAEGRQLVAQRNRLDQRYRLTLGLGAGLMSLAVALPALATIDAVSAAMQEHYAAIAPNTSPRRPVYWVGDRVVYLTTEGTKCYVHVQIANVEQSKRECPRLIAAVTPN